MSEPVRTNTPDILWKPDPGAWQSSNVGRFAAWVTEQHGLSIDDYDDLWRWSTDNLAEFWDAIWRYFDVRCSKGYDEVVTSDPMPATKWFVGAELNYAENCLSAGRGGDVALLGRSQTRGPTQLTFAELRDEVARASSGLQALGVGRGDAVAAYMPNVPETVIAFLAAASLGATFVSCAPEYGVRSVVQRFSQVDPKVLIACDGYRFRGKAVDRSAEVAALRDALPTVQATVAFPYLTDREPEGSVSWQWLRSTAGPLEFVQVDVDHPLYVLFSSGTTGPPKGLVHGHGRILVEHLKLQSLHMGLGPGDVLFQTASTSWMVWNFVISALALGTTVVCFDGDPAWPTPLEFFQVAAETRATSIGCGAQLLMTAMKSGTRPINEVDLSALRALQSTGSPLPEDGFRWVYDAVKPDVYLASGSGGTDVCSGFVGGTTAVLPVVAGEIACRFLGAAVDSFDEAGNSLRGVPGELVLTKPMPSMPVELLNDPTGERYHSSYFDMYPGVWRHGDWIMITDRNTCEISGRSDATLNRAGVRIGTGEIYSVVDEFREVDDSVVVYIEGQEPGDAGNLVLIVATAESSPQLADQLRVAIRRELSPRHVPDRIITVLELPRTLTGKRLEVPIKRILLGAVPDEVLSRGAITNPESVDVISELAVEMLGVRA